MGFLCDCGHGDYEAYLGSKSMTHSLAQRKCCECEEAIPAGTPIWRLTFITVGDEEFHSHDWCCERCENLRQAFTEIGFCTVYGTLIDDYLEWLEMEGKKYPEWVRKLRPNWVANWN